MTTVIQRDNAALLRSTLKGNSIFSIGSGTGIALGSSAIAPFMGLENPLILVLVGIGSEASSFKFQFFYYRIICSDG
jgi:hypothetical protein